MSWWGGKKAKLTQFPWPFREKFMEVGEKLQKARNSPAAILRQLFLLHHFCEVGLELRE